MPESLPDLFVAAIREYVDTVYPGEEARSPEYTAALVALLFLAAPSDAESIARDANVSAVEVEHILTRLSASHFETPSRLSELLQPDEGAEALLVWGAVGAGFACANPDGSFRLTESGRARAEWLARTFDPVPSWSRYAVQ